MTASARRLSSWAAHIAPSPTLAITAKAKELKASGEDVCGFGAGEPDFDTPGFIKEACIEALLSGKTKYVPTAGIPELREALAAKYRTRYGLDEVTASQIVVSPGGKYSCYLAILATCQPGEEVIVPAPYWVSYPEMVKLAGATPVPVSTSRSDGFKLTPDALRSAINEKTRLVILNSPSNPTGAVYSRAEMEAVVDVAIKAGIYILSDEIYEDLLYGGAEHFTPGQLRPEARELTLIASGFSKSFSMTGWRLGTLVAPLDIARAVADLQSQTTSNATSFAQFGALAALRETEKAANAIAEMRGQFDKRRRGIIDALNSMTGLDCPEAQGAFYVFPDVSALGLDSETFTARLLEREKVAVVPGSAFGEDNCVRLSYAIAQATIDKGLERMRRFCEKPD